MGNIIRLPGDHHREAQLLLPWYVTGRLDAADRARVDAHLSACSRCRSELEIERRMESEIAAAPLDVEQGWAAMRRRLEAGAEHGDLPFGRRGAPWRAADMWRAGGPWLGWALAAALTVLTVPGSLRDRDAAPAPYHTLSAPPASPAGNLIVMFRPQTSVQAMAQALNRAGARLVDGPTSAGAYLLLTPAAHRPSALGALRASGEIEMAEPIDIGSRP